MGPDIRLLDTGPRNSGRVSPDPPGNYAEALGTPGNPDLGMAKPSPTLAGIRMGSGISAHVGVLADPHLTGITDVFL